MTKHYKKSRIKSLAAKHGNSIFENINARFPSNSCKILRIFSIFGVDLLLTQCSFVQAHSFLQMRLLIPYLSNGITLNLTLKWSRWRKRMQHLGNNCNWSKSSPKRHWLSGLWKIFKIVSRDRLVFEWLQNLQNLPLLCLLQTHGLNEVPLPENKSSGVQWRTTFWMHYYRNPWMVYLQIAPKAEQLISRVAGQYFQQMHSKVSQIYVQRKISKTICM